MTLPDSLVPYITLRDGEEADSYEALRPAFTSTGASCLGYWWEEADDRDLRGVAWGRCSQSLGRDGLPTGRPRWRLVHPSRQREAMLRLRCQVCMAPTKTPDGHHLFLGSATQHSDSAVIRTAQPPVCVRHAFYSADHCKHLVRRGAVAYLVRSAPLYGVIGTPYRWDKDGIHALAGTDDPVPYGHPSLNWFLASQLVRTLRAFKVIALEDLPPTVEDHRSTVWMPRAQTIER